MIGLIALVPAFALVAIGRAFMLVAPEFRSEAAVDDVEVDG